MLTVSFAFVVATALFFLFRQTRWMGVIGVFVLLCISPVFFSFMLLFVGGVYYLCFRKSSAPSAGALRGPRDQSGKCSLGLLLLLATLGICGVVALGPISSELEKMPAKILDTVRSAPSDDVVVLRTSGGLLEVSRIHATELLDARVPHTILGIEVGELVPRIRVPAVYRYHIELAPEWRVVRNGGVLTVVAPKVRPTLPVAVDFGGLEKDVAGTWLLLPWKGDEDLEDLQRSVTARLALKAASADYMSRQRQLARETVREFVRKWLIEQTGWKTTAEQEIRVLFADESVGAVDRTSR